MITCHTDIYIEGHNDTTQFLLKEYNMGMDHLTVLITTLYNFEPNFQD